MSRDPAGAVISSAFQRIECFCRTRKFISASLGLIASLLLFVGGSALSVESGMEGYVSPDANARSFTLDDAIRFAFQRCVIRAYGWTSNRQNLGPGPEIAYSGAVPVPVNCCASVQPQC